MNCAIYKLGSDTITYFLLDCIQNGNSFEGVNMEVKVKLSVFGTKWTNDDCDPIVGDIVEKYQTLEDQILGWSKTVSELTEVVSDSDIDVVDHETYRQAVRMRHKLSKMTKSELENYIDKNVTDLASTKDFLKELATTVLGVTIIMDK